MPQCMHARTHVVEDGEARGRLLVRLLALQPGAVQPDVPGGGREGKGREGGVLVSVPPPFFFRHSEDGTHTHTHTDATGTRPSLHHHNASVAPSSLLRASW